MNWEEVGAIGQVLGSIAVFITLGYLAIQVRHARQETRRSISQGRSAATRELAMFHSGTNQLNMAFYKGNLALGGQIPPMYKQWSDAGLTPEEIGAVVWREFAWWSYRQQTVSQIDELPSGERIEFEQGIRNAYGRNANALSRLWYQQSKVTLNPDAVRYIDNLLAQPASTASQSTA